MHSRLVRGTLIVLCWQLLAPGLAWADDALLQAGQRYFQRHDYSSAEEFFRVASQSQPPTAEAHYWYATTLAKRFRGSDAVIEYERCLALHPSALIADYCRAALAGYGVATSGTPQLVAPRRVSGWSVGTHSAPVQPIKLSQNPRALDAASASARIRDEVGAEQRRLHDAAQFAATEKQLEGAEFAARYMDKIPRSTQQLLKQPGLIAVPGQVNRRDIYYEEMADRETRRARDSVSAIDHEYHDRQDGLAASAENLQEQLTASPSAHTSTLLQPLGTNIYVRNYEPIGPAVDDEPVFIAPMKAHAEKLHPSPASTGVSPLKPQNQP
ncbi:MAG TPA: hypothetical protein V6D22_06775 [Candidatus Obscuribacterales bacterium]